MYDDFIMGSQLLILTSDSKLLKQGFTRNRLIATFKKFYGRHSVLVDKFKVSVTNIIIDLLLETLYRWWLYFCALLQPELLPILTFSYGALLQPVVNTYLLRLFTGFDFIIACGRCH